MVEVVVVGSATIDEQVLPGQPPRTQIGGGVTYAGAAFAQWGLSALAVCKLGGGWGRAARARLRQLGIAVESGATPEMTSFRNAVSAEGEREQTLISLARPIDRALVTRALDRLPPPHVHLGPLHGNDIDADALELLAL